MNKKYFIFGIVTITLLGIIIGLILHINNINEKNNEVKIINATVLIVGDDYLIVTDENEQDYMISTSDTKYNINDYINVEIVSIDDKKVPITGVAKKITLIKKAESKEKEETSITDNNSNNTNTNTTDNNKKEEVKEIEQSTTNNQSEETTTEEKYNDNKVIEYFQTLNDDLDKSNSDQTTKEKIKSKFTTIIDFLFYDGTIGGRTFNELSSKAKLKVITLALSIDTKIDNKIPGYKNTISSKYQNVKNKLITKYLDVTTNICNDEPDLCDNAKEGFHNLKTSFGITWQLIKELAGSGIDKLKDWYEIWKYK